LFGASDELLLLMFFPVLSRQGRALPAYAFAVAVRIQTNKKMISSNSIL
jgi:hypothetical protein